MAWRQRRHGRPGVAAAVFRPQIEAAAAARPACGPLGSKEIAVLLVAAGGRALYPALLFALDGVTPAERLRPPCAARRTTRRDPPADLP